MNNDKLLFNELADDAALVGRNTFANANTTQEDGAAKLEALKVARRLAAIDVSMWSDEPDFKKHAGKDFSRLREQRAKEVKSKVDEAISNTAGGETHSLFAEGS